MTSILEDPVVNLPTQLDSPSTPLLLPTLLSPSNPPILPLPSPPSHVRTMSDIDLKITELFPSNEHDLSEIATLSDLFSRKVSLKSFHFEITLGTGTHTYVQRIRHQRTNKTYACKINDVEYLNKVPGIRWHHLQNEIQTLRSINHPSLIKFHQFIETETHVYIITEHIKGGDLYDYIEATGALRNDEYLKFFAQIVQGLLYLHNRNLCHRDLKPENIMLDEAKNVKIIDFGFARPYTPSTYLTTRCGSDAYMAPEVILNKSYDPRRSEVWTLGVILYAMVTGNLPFDSDSIPSMYASITEGRYTIPKWISPPIKSLIKDLLTVNLQKRILLENIYLHEAFSGTVYFAPNLVG